jgi:hypothetical protein
MVFQLSLVPFFLNRCTKAVSVVFSEPLESIVVFFKNIRFSSIFSAHCPVVCKQAFSKVDCHAVTWQFSDPFLAAAFYPLALNVYVYMYIVLFVLLSFLVGRVFNAQKLLLQILKLKHWTCHLLTVIICCHLTVSK